MASALFFLAAAAFPAVSLATELGIVDAGNLIRYPIIPTEGGSIFGQHERRQDRVGALGQRSGTIYTINLSVGTPGQSIPVQFDTGANELWVNPVCSAATDKAFCTAQPRFTQSTTLVDYGVTGYNNIVRGPAGDGTGYVDFEYVSDYVSVGSARIGQQIFGVAYNSVRPSVGILGAGPDPSGWDSAYPLLIDNLAQQGFINSRAFSMDLQGLGSTDGSVIYGGIDTSKYSGSLIKLPIVPAAASPTGNTGFFVRLDGVSVNQADGTVVSVYQKPAGGVGQVAQLHSGYTISSLPSAWMQKLVAAYPSAQAQAGGLYSVDCLDAGLGGSLDFTFGDKVINVPYNDFVWHDPNSGLCILGAFEDNTLTVLGDTFLRAAYVVFDWDNRNIHLAQTADCGSNLVAIGSGVDAVPSIVGGCAAPQPTSTSSTVASSTSTTESSSATSEVSTTTDDPSATSTETSTSSSDFPTSTTESSSTETSSSGTVTTEAPTATATSTSSSSTETDEDTHTESWCEPETTSSAISTDTSSSSTAEPSTTDSSSSSSTETSSSAVSTDTSSTSSADPSTVTTTSDDASTSTSGSTSIASTMDSSTSSSVADPTITSTAEMPTSTSSSTETDSDTETESWCEPETETGTVTSSSSSAEPTDTSSSSSSSSSAEPTDTSSSSSVASSVDPTDVTSSSTATSTASSSSSSSSSATPSSSATETVSSTSVTSSTFSASSSTSSSAQTSLVAPTLATSTSTSSSASGSTSTSAPTSLVDPTFTVTSPGSLSTSTSTFTTTSVYTITSCSPDKTACHPGAVTTETVTSVTTFCPEASITPAPQSTVAPTVTKSTLTNTLTTTYTVTSCAPFKFDCRAGQVTTEVVTVLTTICPQTTGTYTFSKTWVCSAGENGCSVGAIVTAAVPITVVPATASATPILVASITPGAAGPSAAPGSVGQATGARPASGGAAATSAGSQGAPSSQATPAKTTQGAAWTSAPTASAQWTTTAGGNTTVGATAKATPSVVIAGANKAAVPVLAALVVAVGLAAVGL